MLLILSDASSDPGDSIGMVLIIGFVSGTLIGMLFGAVFSAFGGTAKALTEVLDE